MQRAYVNVFGKIHVFFSEVQHAHLLYVKSHIPYFTSLAMALALDTTIGNGEKMRKVYWWMIYQDLNPLQHPTSTHRVDE